MSQQWIKRSEQEPPRDGTAFIAHNPDEWSSPRVLRWSTVGCFYYGYLIDSVDTGFTHWLPLPPLPEDEK